MVFSIPTFTTIGDDYDKRVIDERGKGKNFLVPSPHWGKNPDALFTKEFQSIHEGDRYIDPGTAERRYRIEKAKKNIVPQGFRYASFPQKSTGSGSYYGTIDGKPIPHETEFIVPRKGDVIQKKPIQPRNMVTNPTKKGGYGVPGTTLSNVGQDYIADFYDAPRIKAQQEREEHRRKMKGAAFRISGRRGYTFDEALGTGVSTCYTLTAPIPPRKPKQLNKYSIVHKKIEHPWRPAGSIPNDIKVEYHEDPYDGKDPRDPPRKKREEALKAASNGAAPRAVWKPNSCTNDSWYTSTIAFKKL